MTAPPRRTRLESPFGAVYSQLSREYAMGRGDRRLRTPAPPAVRTLREARVRTPDAEGRRVWAGRRTTVSRRLRPWGKGRGRRPLVLLCPSSGTCPGMRWALGPGP